MSKQESAKITLPFFSNLALKITAFLNRVLVFLQLREKRSFWGVVYDSLTKQPLDPVKVSLIYADSGKVESTGITDLAGRYGFLARPGRFKIFVQHTGYAFPSQIVKGEKDGIYTHLYHGEFFELTQDSEVVAPNIPMDALGKDWNQQAKRRFVWQSFYWRWFLEKLVSVFLWFGFIYSSTLFVLSRFESRSAAAALGVYIAVFILELSIPVLRLWGKVSYAKTGRGAERLNLKLLNPRVTGVSFGSAKSREDGRFFLRANPGQYLLQVEQVNQSDALGTALVEVGPEGVFNAEISVGFLKKQ